MHISDQPAGFEFPRLKVEKDLVKNLATAAIREQKSYDTSFNQIVFVIHYLKTLKRFCVYSSI